MCMQVTEKQEISAEDLFFPAAQAARFCNQGDERETCVETVNLGLLYVLGMHACWYPTNVASYHTTMRICKMT